MRGRKKPDRYLNQAKKTPGGPGGLLQLHLGENLVHCTRLEFQFSDIPMTYA